jgi:hypothetical protein
MDPLAHSTSSMQEPPSATLPENTAAHAAGTLPVLRRGSPQAELASEVRQAVACAGSKWAVPFDTVVTAADGALKLTTAS